MQDFINNEPVNADRGVASTISSVDASATHLIYYPRFSLAETSNKTRGDRKVHRNHERDNELG